MIQHCLKPILKERVYVPYMGTVHHGRKPGQTLKKGSWREEPGSRDHGAMLFTGLDSLACLAFLGNPVNET